MARDPPSCLAWALTTRCWPRRRPAQSSSARTCGCCPQVSPRARSRGSSTRGRLPRRARRSRGSDGLAEWAGRLCAQRQRGGRAVKAEGLRGARRRPAGLSGRPAASSPRPALCRVRPRDAPAASAFVLRRGVPSPSERGVLAEALGRARGLRRSFSTTSRSSSDAPRRPTSRPHPGAHVTCATAGPCRAGACTWTPGGCTWLCRALWA